MDMKDERDTMEPKARNMGTKMKKNGQSPRTIRFQKDSGSGVSLSAVTTADYAGSEPDTP